MLKGMKFLITKSRGRVSGETKPTPPAPVILGRDTQSVPRIFLQQVTNLNNKTALQSYHIAENNTSIPAIQNKLAVIRSEKPWSLRL